MSISEQTRRFFGLADTYAKHRPGYPAEALQFIIAHCGLAQGSSIADVGCGTGISSRCFADHGFRVAGIEPNAEMHASAIAQNLGKIGELLFFIGSGEATGMPSAEFDAVTAAQSFHWMNHNLALKEFWRILKPGGWVVLLWNECDKNDPFSAAYQATLEAVPDPLSREMLSKTGEALLNSSMFKECSLRQFKNQQILGQDELLGLAFSNSYARGQNQLVSKLEMLFARHQVKRKVVLQYQTSVYTGQSIKEITQPQNFP